MELLKLMHLLNKPGNFELLKNKTSWKTKNQNEQILKTRE